MFVPGDIVRRMPFISYSYRYDDVDYSDGLPDITPLLHTPRRITSVSWPIRKLGLVIYVASVAASTCLLMVPDVGIIWVPVGSLRHHQTVHEEEVEG